MIKSRALSRISFFSEKLTSLNRFITSTLEISSSSCARLQKIPNKMNERINNLFMIIRFSSIKDKKIYAISLYFSPHENYFI